MEKLPLDYARARWHLFQKFKDPAGPEDRMIYRDKLSQNQMENKCITFYSVESKHELHDSTHNGT